MKWANKKLEAIRVQQELSIADVAFILGVPEKEYRSIEEGRTEPSLKQLIKLCRFYQISPDEFLTDEKDGSDLKPSKTPVRTQRISKIPEPAKAVVEDKEQDKERFIYGLDQPKEKITAKKAVEILKKHGTIVTEEEAAKVLEFMNTMARLAIDQVTEELEREEKLKDIPGGFEFDKPYSCQICGNSAKGGWYDQYGIKCRLCQVAVDQKIIPGKITRHKESYYTDYDLKYYFSLKGAVLTRWIKQGLLKERVILAADQKHRHYRIFLLSDHKGFLPPKKKLKIEEIVTYMEDGKECKTRLKWYECTDPFQYLKKYKIMDHMKYKDAPENKEDMK